MTIDLDSIFRYRTANRDKLLGDGFSAQGTGLQKQVPIMKKQFTLIVTVEADNTVRFEVRDNKTAEEYILVRVARAQGGFVGELRAACEKVLCDIARKDFDSERLKAEQTKRILAFLAKEYQVEPEFLWERSPDAAALRRKDNEKWFAIIMTVDRSKLGVDAHGAIEIMDLKAAPDSVEALLEQDGYYPAYHMNKKHWFTICLDGSRSDEELHALLAASFACAAKK